MNPRMGPDETTIAECRLEIVPGAQWESLRDDWVSLWRRCPGATPFQAAGWLLPWARIYGGDRCRAVAARADGHLVALLPVFTWQGALLLAGTGPSDYGDGLFAPGFEGLAGDMLAALAGECDCIDLRQLPPGSPLLAAPAPAGRRDGTAADTVCPVAELAGADGLAAASARWCANWRYYSRRVERAGGAIESVPPGDLEAAMTALQDLHDRRWRSQGEAGVFADTRLREFLPAAATALARERLTRLYRLRFGAETVAALLAFRGNGGVHYYISGFAPDCGSLSPGTVLLGTAMTQAAEDGARAFHFLRGAESYKYRCGAVDTWPRRRVLHRE